MKFDIAKRSAGWLDAFLYGIHPTEEADYAPRWRYARLGRQGLSLVLSALMIMIPMGQSNAFAQDTLPGVDQSGPPPGAPPDAGAPGPQGQPLTPDQLDQMVAPIALYPDNLVAQVLAASTYPTQVVEADRWLKEQGSAPPSQIAAGANSMNWDASVKALTAFPSVLAQMDRNIQWTTDLGNAYYNQPQDVMDAVQAMRQRAQSAGNLRSNQQETVTTEGPNVEIAPANPEVVYVPYYDPWTVWGGPFVPYPGFYYAPPVGIYFGGLAIGFGIGIGIGLWGGWGWGWGHWGLGWGWHGGFRGVAFNHNTYITRSSTVYNRGFGRPGGPPRSFAGTRGSFANRGAGGFNRGGTAGGFNRGGTAGGFNRGGAAGFNRGATAGGTNRGATSGGFRGGNTGASRGASSGGFNRGASSGGFRGGSAGASRPSGGFSRAGGGGGFHGGGGGGFHGGGGGSHGGGGGHHR
jgi:hypothetical protein